MSCNEDVLRLLDHLRTIRICFGAYYSRILSQEKLTLQNYTMIYILSSAGSINMKTMAKKLGVTNPAVTHLVDISEKRGFIRRTRSTTDRRVTLLEINQQGQAFIEKIEKRLYAILSKSFLEFDKPTRENIQKFYKEVIRNFDEELCDENK
jgi:DNA-binding MarR family transcriptional regulator